MVILSSKDRGCTALLSSHRTFALRVLTEKKCEGRAAIFDENDDGSIVK
jgi:hypothetical protein